MILPPGLNEADFNDVLRQFREVVGEEWVFVTDYDLNGYRDGYSPLFDTDDEPLPSAAVAPANVEEVQALVAIANEYKIPFWINSAGKNWGYGGPAGVIRGTVNLDLKRMNRIIEVNEKQAYCLVEPGVTFFDLYKYIRERDIKLWLDVPSPAWGSIIGNTIEYGLGYTNYGQRINFLCGMEVVLPNGDLVRTGQGAIPGSQTWSQYRRGIGPRVDELFCQTSLGIVTKMGLWLQPEPPAYLAATVFCDRNEKLIPMLDIMRPMRHAGIIDNNATLYRHPFVQEGEEDPANPGGWRNRIAFYGLEKVVKEQWEYVQDTYSAERPDFTFESNLHTRPYDYEALGKGPDQLMAGIPRLFANVHKSYFSMVLPFEGQAAWDLILTFDEVSKKYGRRYFGMAHHIESPHAIITTSSVVLKQGDKKYNADTVKMVKGWMDAAAERGWSAYRTSTPYMDDTMAKYNFNNGALLRLHHQLKDALDPNGIIAPGKNGIWPQHMREDKA